MFVAQIHKKAEMIPICGTKRMSEIQVEEQARVDKQTRKMANSIFLRMSDAQRMDKPSLGRPAVSVGPQLPAFNRICLDAACVCEVSSASRLTCMDFTRD